MLFKQVINNAEQKEKPVIEIVCGSEAPEENKNNPFYNSYHWGMADWVNNKLYLPDNSDEAISFSIAAHELGHLVDNGRIEPNRFEFEPTYREELRAWDIGWKYLEKYLPEYYSDNNEGSSEELQKNILELSKIKNAIQEEILDMTRLTKSFYRETDKNKNEQRNEFLETEEGKIIKTRIDNLEMKVQEIARGLDLTRYLETIDWGRFIGVINKALMDIEKDNKAENQN